MRISLAAVAIFLIAGCAVGLSGRGKDTSHETTDPGAGLYKRKCIACHILPEPGDHDDREWSEILEDHQKKIGLSDEDKSRLYQYLTGKAETTGR